jgi:hypothetical protein
MRRALPEAVKRAVLMEAGYRCAVPTCRTILALDLHHIEELQDGGGDELSNLIALCPTCHALYTRRTISRDAIHSWKGILVALNHAFDKESISNLLFLKAVGPNGPLVSGDGVLQFSHLIAAGLATFSVARENGPLILYRATLTPKGAQIVEAWFSGDRGAVRDALAANV